MSISDEVKRLQKKWDSAAGWPKRLEWLRLTNVRGWRGQRINFNFPIVAIVGENGSGKSTILQSAAAVYRSPAGTKNRFPSDFFPDTAWERQRGVELEFSVREGDRTTTGSVRKRTERWLGNPDRRERQVFYFDLSRLQPIATRVGYARIARAGAHESNATSFNEESVGRLTAILGRLYSSAKKATSSIDKTREVTVLTRDGKDYSGFHQGAGEMTIAELVSQEVPKTSLVLIDEVETSLHPRAQRRLVRDLAEVSRLNDIQFILTTHSPYVLDALPSHARLYISNNSLSKEVLTGVTSHYAMSKMDDASHFNVDVYVEDKAAKAIIDEVLALDLPNEYAYNIGKPLRTFVRG